MHEAALSIMGRLRARDAAELAELGVDPESAATAFASPAVLARTFTHDGQPAAIVAFHRLTPRTVAASLMATDDWPRVARAVIRWGIREARPALLNAAYARAECRTMEGHGDAIRLLERLGFVCECRVPNFGANRTAFLQYAWRLEDHVPVQIAESPAAATPTADTGLEARGGAERAQAPRQTQRLQHADTVRDQRRDARQPNNAEDVAGWLRLNST
ncbi:MAG: hypothetical protein ACKVRO_18140 [Micropepsaceae bacterium]